MSRSGRTFSVLAGILAISAGTALAGPEDKFAAADADESGTLTIEEFKDTLSKNAKQKQIEKKFGRADADDSGEVTLEEYIAFKADDGAEDKPGKARKKRKLTDSFERVDGDGDGFLTYDEFLPLIKGKRPLIETRLRFLRTDADDDGLVSLDEWLDSKLRKLPKEFPKPGKFDLADIDGDGALTFDEFTAVYPQKQKEAVVFRKFNRKDDNDDGLLTKDEWNPGKGKSKGGKP